MYHTIGILAHVDAGKTSLSEQILYHTKVIRSPGRVDDRTTLLDADDIEKQRGITIFSDQAWFQYKDHTCYLVDTPGHMDFSAETERAVSILDYAVLVISGTEGVQAHTLLLFRLLKKYQIPVFLFINKMDQPAADLEKAMQSIRQKLGITLLFLPGILSREKLPEHMLEDIASMKESSLEQYLEGNFSNEAALSLLVRLFHSREIFPCMAGSALYDTNISELIENFTFLMKDQFPAGNHFSGLVYKIRHDHQNNPVTFLKVLTGTLRVKEELTFESENSSAGNQPLREKVDQIRIYQGKKFSCVKEAYAGQLVGVTGLTIPSCGDRIGTSLPKKGFEFVPALKMKVTASDSAEDKQLFSILRQLEKEDPALAVSYEPSLKEIYVHLMGRIQAEILKQLLSDRFHISAVFGSPEVLYLETIASPVMGYGHFEPLRHYAEVNLRLEPLSAGSGILFESECPSDVLPQHFQNLIRTHIFEKEHKGVLTGSPLTDVKIILTNGRAHIKHTEGGDFREAAYRAVRQALEKADSVLLEPYFQFELFCPQSCVGRILSDMQKRHGTIEPVSQEHSEVFLKGCGPVSEFMNYSLELAAISKGKGSIHLLLDGYRPCHNTETILETKNYCKEADTENTSSSVFCRKGQSFLVTWDQAEQYMHCI